METLHRPLAKEWIGGRVREERETLGLSQRACALDVLHINPGRMTYIEGGKDEAIKGWPLAATIAEFIGVPPEEVAFAYNLITPLIYRHVIRQDSRSPEALSLVHCTLAEAGYTTE